MVRILGTSSGTGILLGDRSQKAMTTVVDRSGTSTTEQWLQVEKGGGNQTPNGSPVTAER